MNFINWFKTKKELIKQIRHLLSENNKLTVDKDKYIKLLEDKNLLLEERDILSKKCDKVVNEYKNIKTEFHEWKILIQTSKSFKEFKDTLKK